MSMTRLRTWLRHWAILGLAVAAFWLLIGLGFEHPYATYVFYLFPGGFFTMALELGERTVWDIALVVTVALLSNVLLYGAVGLFLWVLGQVARRLSRRSAGI
jgi:hypothetical protein